MTGSGDGAGRATPVVPVVATSRRPFAASTTPSPASSTPSTQRSTADRGRAPTASGAPRMPITFPNSQTIAKTAKAPARNPHPAPAAKVRMVARVDKPFLRGVTGLLLREDHPCAGLDHACQLQCIPVGEPDAAVRLRASDC